MVEICRANGFDVAQALRPFPHAQNIGVQWAQRGKSWYDSLQAKVTKRYSRGLTVDAAFTWQKELNLGVASDTSYLTPAPNLINDVFNRDSNKQISAFSRPFMMVITASYTTPGFSATGTVAAQSSTISCALSRNLPKSIPITAAGTMPKFDRAE